MKPTSSSSGTLCSQTLYTGLEIGLPLGFVKSATAINAPTKARSSAMSSQRKNFGAVLLRRQQLIRVVARE